ncbi:MAG: Peptide chain release factor RF1 [Chlamydiia bacterium]|nr:Peptide chain release factor RF1 [Chlamydiia bacterium]
MEDKVKELLAEFEQLESDLGNPEIVNDRKRYKELTQRHSYLSSLRDAWLEYEAKSSQLESNKDLLKSETDPEFIEVIEEENGELEKLVPELKAQIEVLIVPPDALDNCNTIVEVRAGTGGDEAALFVGDCVRMYSNFANSKGWSMEMLSCSPSEAGGFKEYMCVFTGSNVFRTLKYEAGTHRVQRIPATESSGRVHTSAITVAVIPEADDDVDVHIEEKDLRIDTFRSSGAGGQHVNTTDSAVRITHEPTGIVVSCQQERSQIKNREKAMRLLRAKIAEEERLRKQAEQAETRKGQVGSGDRSERIRTYNFPQNRVTDHRINLTLYKLDQIIEGDMEELTSALIKHYYQKQFETGEG